MVAFDAEMQARLARLAAELVSPVGQLPFERVACRHLGLFDDLRTFGLTWSQIATVLHRHGIARRNGAPLSGAQLSSVVSRQRQPDPASPARSSPHQQGVNDISAIRLEPQTKSSLPSNMTPLPAPSQSGLTASVGVSPLTDAGKEEIRARMREQKALRDRLERGSF